MSEVRDPAITLFGRKIPLPDFQIPAEFGDKSDLDCQIQPVVEVMDECGEATKMEVEGPAKLESGKRCDPLGLVEGEENTQPTPTTQDNKATVDCKPDEDCPTETDLVCQEKAFKKPDKVLPCPRCNSLDTKFCYFNNYNVNQPRHFCKNCQRYWTAGGTMRNVPVGAGRRKNKHSFTQNRQVMSSDGVPVSQVDTLPSTSHQLISCVGLSPCSRPSHGTDEVLNSTSDVPLCESMGTVLNLEEQKRGVETGSMAHGVNGEEPSSSGSSLTSTGNEFPEKVIPVEQTSLAPNAGIPGHPLQCYPGPPWAYSWNPGWNEIVYRPESGNPYQIQWGSPPMIAVPGFCTPSITVPIVPASYWGSMPGWDIRKWNSPLVGCTSGLSPSSASNTGCSDNNSPTLGKHSRDANLQVEEKTEKFLWVPKTLRIDDPDEAAKSSIWATLGIKPDRNQPVLKGGIFKAFQSKTEGSVNRSDADQILHANPAALSRSHTFQEST